MRLHNKRLSQDQGSLYFNVLNSTAVFKFNFAAFRYLK
jgi:hypothetical protein